jgi:hypothetical protein
MNLTASRPAVAVAARTRLAGTTELLYRAMGRQVDPKTVRRWLEGRVPYLRHRWALAGLLDADEADLWPELRARAAWRSGCTGPSSTTPSSAPTTSSSSASTPTAPRTRALPFSACFLRLCRADGGDMVTVYLESFEPICADAAPLE